MGIGDFISDITPDVVEDAVEDGAEWVGNRVEDAGNWTADRLQDVGWESGADWVREQSRSLANRMGAEVDELDLGQTEDKTRLIHGSPGKITSVADQLSAFRAAFDSAGDGLRGLDSSRLTGEAADALRAALRTQPPQWWKAADACAEAVGALDSFAGTVTWAQGQAQTAIDTWKEGVKASEDAADAHRRKVDAFNSAVDRYNALPADRRDPTCLPPRPADTFDDPGRRLMQQAQDLLAEARRQRNAAAETAREAIRAARDLAPEKPSYAQQAMDGLGELRVMGDHFGAGILKGAAGIVNFVRAVNPLDPYNLTHPAEYATSLNSLASGLLLAANDPIGTGSQMLNTFMKDPAEGVGRLIPDVALTLATGGGGAVVRGVRIAEEAADAARLRRLLDESLEGAADRPDHRRTSDGSDPVDLATGRMYLPQTDVDIPGILPLVFTRRTESGLATGRFLGPAWSSTVDERLTVDAVGVLHSTADGLLLPYPHPAPGAPTRSWSPGTRPLLARDADGHYTLTDPDTGLVRHFTAPAGAEPGGDGTAWLTALTARGGHRVTLDRAEDGLPLALVHSAGHAIRLTTAGGRVTALTATAPDGTEQPLIGYGYGGETGHGDSGERAREEDGGVDLVTVTRPSGATTVFRYDDHHRVTSWTDSNGHRYDYAYDDRDRVVAEGGEARHVAITLDYTEPDPETGHRTTVLTTADGRATRHLVGPGCRILATTDALGRTTRFHHDRAGRLLSRTDPLGATTAFTHDDEGRLLTATRPDGTRLTVTRGPFGLPTRIVGPDGAATTYAYDERGNRTAVTDPLGHTTRTTHDDGGRLTSVTDALGLTTGVVCDAAGLTVAVTDPSDAVTRTERDLLGRPVRVTDPTGAVTRLTWDADGNLARRTAPGGASESWTYDGEGNCLTHTDPAGGVTRHTYTHFDLPLTTTRPDGGRYAFEHDQDLRLTQVTDPRGLTWNYTYDAVGGTVAETDFDGRTLTYRLDAAGRLLERTDALGGTVAFTRDRLGQVTTKTVDGRRVTRYAHDPAGRLLEAVGPESELRYQYDRRGLVKTELVDGRAISYAYDALGRRVRRTTPTGHVTTYAYDSDGHRSRLTSGGRTIDFTHDATGRELTRVIADSLTLTSAWDAAGRLAARHLRAGGAREITGRAYTYRADGHLRSVTDQVSGATRTFDLDPLGRVTAVHAPGWSERYAYDDTGRPTDADWPDRHPDGGARGPRAYRGTAVTRAGDLRLGYDALGRVTLRRKTRLSRRPDSWHYTWDSENRLTSVTTPDGTRWRYRYDPLGRRTAKQRLADDGSVADETLFTWDGLTLCEETGRRPGTPHTVALTWDHRDVVPLAQTERLLSADGRQEEIDRRFFAIATDLVGTPTELVDESGDIAWRTRTTLWGTTAWSRDSSTYTPLRLPGQYYDPETGLHHNGFRYYDPATGRYTSPDPLGLAPAPDPLGYVPNPLTGSDPLGLMPKYTKEERALQRSTKAADGVIERAQDGTFRKHPDYHGDTRHGFSDERVLEILRSPDAVYQSTGTSGNLVFRQGEDIVVTHGPGSQAGQAITAYGPSGVRGDSGAAALGGKPTDPGGPVTHEDIVNGRIPSRDGFIPPAVQIK
ncbi:putative T7SS-secreted protein [Streptomyces sp. NPDC004610]|uniref:putative T7SS-secreted protein n=1 Tax=unclassified Streptomyces TaxID=2593676 RepID=UPI0033B5E6F1